MSRVELSEQKELDASAARTMTDQSRGDHSRVVEDQRIADVEKFSELEKSAMADRLRSRIEHHQSRGVSRFERLLCDQFFGQFIVKFTQQYINQLQCN